METKRFQVYKKAVDGSNDKWGFVYNLTIEEARDLKKYPSGLLTESDGRKYFWSYSLMERYC